MKELCEPKVCLSGSSAASWLRSPSYHWTLFDRIYQLNKQLKHKHDPALAVDRDRLMKSLGGLGYVVFWGIYKIRRPFQNLTRKLVQCGLAKANWKKNKFPESELAHRLLDGLSGLEIGGSAHNPFGLHTKNVDYTSDMNTIFKQSEVERVGEALKVDIVAPGDAIPVPDESQDFVISSHVIEHFFDPIRALKEWLRVIRPGGYIFIVAPHKERTFDRARPRTTLQELIDRHASKISDPKTYEHHSVWITEDLLELCSYLNYQIVACQDTDDKVGNGFTVVIQKPGELPSQAQKPSFAR